MMLKDYLEDKMIFAIIILFILTVFNFIISVGIIKFFGIKLYKLLGNKKNDNSNN